MFWHEEDEVDVETLRERFESEWRRGELGYFSQGELQELFDWYVEEENYPAARSVIEHADYLYPNWAQVEWWRSILAYQEERYLEAYVQGMRAFEQLPLNEEVYQHLIEICLAVGRTDQAMWILELWWDEFPQERKRVWASRFLAEGLLYRNELALAAAVLWRAWEVASSAQEMRLVRLLVSTYRRAKEYEKGIRAFETRLWETPMRVPLWLGLARLYLEKFAYAQALQALEQAELLLSTEEKVSNAWHAEFYILRALWHEAHGHREEAFRAWLWARHYQPQNPIILSKLLEHYLQLGDEVAIQAYIERLHRTGMHLPQVRRQIADYYQRREEYDQALLYYKSLLASKKERPYALGQIFLAALRKGDASTLRQALRYAVRYFPNRPEVWSRWVKAMFEAGYKAFALRFIEYAMKMEDFIPSAAIYYWHALLSVHNRQYEAGLISLELGLLRSPSQVKFFLEGVRGLFLPSAYQRLLNRYLRDEFSVA